LALVCVAGLLLFVVDRALILGSSTHLLFDLNDAEYGFLRAALPFEGMSVMEVWSDPDLRRRFLHGCRTVGNQVHGSLAITGTLFLGLLDLPGVVPSTLLMKVLALATACVALLSWMIALARGLPGRAIPLAFALLYTLCPLVLLKLGLLLWGTHEVVLALQGLLLAATAPWIARAARTGRGRLLRAGLLGVGGAVLVLGNYAMLLAVGMVTGWLVLRALLTRRGLPWAPLMIAAFGAAFVGTLQLILGSDVLAGMGFPPRIDPGHFLLLAGKGGDPFLFESARSAGGSSLLGELSAWSEEIRRSALPMMPSARYGRHAEALELTVRAGCGVLSVLGLLAFGWARLRGNTRGWAQPMTAFLALYLLVGWLGISLISIRFGLTPGGVAGFQPRYFAQLYPVALALLATLAAAPRLVGAPALLGVLWLGAFDNAQLIDLDNRGALLRYDGVAVWLQRHGDRIPEDAPLASTSDAYRDGYAVITAHQHGSYWRWTWPAELARPAFITPLRRATAAAPDDPDYWRGVGAALGVLIPPARKVLFDEVCRAFPDHADALREGWAPPG